MEQGAKTILLLLGVSLALGLLVIAGNPDYRRAVRSCLDGKPEASPIWRSNESYYETIGLTEKTDGETGRGQ